MGQSFCNGNQMLINNYNIEKLKYLFKKCNIVQHNETRYMLVTSFLKPTARILGWNSGEKDKESPEIAYKISEHVYLEKSPDFINF